MSIKKNGNSINEKDFFDEIFFNYMSGKDIVLINIGTSKIVGDSYGPLLGTLLEKQLKIIYSYGTLIDPIHYVNLENKVNEIKELHPNAYIIAIDACLSYDEKNCNAHYVIEDTGVRPGTGFNKKSFLIGDASIKFCIKANKDEDTLSILKKEHTSKLYFNTLSASKMIKRFDNILKKTLKGSGMNAINN